MNLPEKYPEFVLMMRLIALTNAKLANAFECEPTIQGQNTINTSRLFKTGCRNKMLSCP